MTQSITDAFVAGVDALVRDLDDPGTFIGISDQHVRLIRQPHLWNSDDRMQVDGILSELLNVANARAGLPSMQLPAELVACLICRIVAPCNRLVAAQRAPNGYAGIKATGLVDEPVIESVSAETMFALVIAFSGGYQVPPRVESVEEVLMKQQQEQKDDS